MDYDYLQKEVDKKRDMRKIIRDEIKKTSDSDLKSKFRKLLVKNITLLSASSNVYGLSYDSMSEGLEPIYFWFLDFLTDSGPNGIKMDEVIKYKDEYDASVASGYFGEMGSRASVMQDRAMKIMATINTVVRSIINLIYDLKEFNIRLGYYDELRSGSSSVKSAARLALKQIWMDQVDIKKSRGSINALSQQLEFVTLRDAFLAIDSIDKIEGVDLNERVKRILAARLEEYDQWEKNSEKELRKRFNIERSYLKSQVASLKHYTAWVKPNLIAAKRLGTGNFTTASGRPSPSLVNSFSNMEVHLGLFGKTLMKPEDVNPRYANITFDQKFYSCIEVDIVFRTVPRSYQGQYGSHYVHSGRTDIILKSYALSQEEIDEIYQLKDQEDLELIEEMTSVSLKEIQEDIELFLKDEDELKEKSLKGQARINFLREKLSRSTTSEEKKSIQKQIDEEILFLKQQGIDKITNPFRNVYDGFKEATKPFKYLFSAFGLKHNLPGPEKNIRKEALEKAEKLCFVVYDVYKKAHGMLTW